MSRKRWILVGIGAAALAVIVFICVKVSDIATYGRIATGYTAQQTCACLHVSGRTLESCKSDYPADAVSQIRFDVTGERVRVSAGGGLFKAEATYDERYGCRISP